MKKTILITVLMSGLLSSLTIASDLAQSIKDDYQNRLGAMFRDFHINPEEIEAKYFGILTKIK